MKFQSRYIGLAAYLIFVILPLYWMINLSLQPNADILGSFSLYPERITFHNYVQIFTRPDWYGSFLNSIFYVLLNMAISLAVALPAAYGFSRYTFIGDKHLFFWLLTNRMAPPAVFLLPFFQLYQNLGLYDTHIAVALAHALFNVPLAVWILEGFMRGIPKEIDETAYIDGYTFHRFFITIFIPLIRGGIGVTAFFVFVFSWVELLLARTLTSTDARPFSVTMTQTISATGIDWGMLAAAGVVTLIPGAVVIWFVRNNLARGLSLGRV